MSAAELEKTPIGAEDFILPGGHDVLSEKEPNTRALFLIPAEEKSHKILAPVDELTRMPLPVLPPPGIRQLIRGENSKQANWHHQYHPSNSIRLTSAAGLAVRHVRLQLLPVETHHNRYHKIFEGPEYLPRTSEERFGHIILACAGYIPPNAIDVYNKDPSDPVGLSKRMRHRLQNSGEVEVRGHTNIANFMKDYLVNQDFSEINESIIEEFLTTKSLQRKKFLGHWLLGIASEIAVEPIQPIYRQALDEGLIIPKTKLPNLVKSQINGPKTSQRAIRALHRRLTKSYLQTGVNRVELAS